jgi:nucleotide-binding universal stress UspA family protein
MKTILILTDFSEAANNAARFGISLAKSLGANVTFLHAYHFPEADPIGPAYRAMGHTVDATELGRDYQKGINTLLDRLVAEAQLALGPQAAVKSRSIAGMALDGAVASLELSDDSLAVMGTRGHGKSTDLLVGSNAARMVEHAPMPVIVVPKDAKQSQVKTVLFASGLLEKDVPHLLWLKPMLEALHARLELVHLASRKIMDEQDAMEGYKEIVHDHFDYPDMHFHLMEESNVIDGIIEAASTHHADLVVMHTLR